MSDLSKSLEQLQKMQKLMQKTVKEANNALNIVMKETGDIAKTNEEIIATKVAHMDIKGIILKAEKGEDISSQVQVLKDKYKIK